MCNDTKYKFCIKKRGDLWVFCEFRQVQSRFSEIFGDGSQMTSIHIRWNELTIRPPKGSNAPRRVCNCAKIYDAIYNAAWRVFSPGLMLIALIH